MKTRRYRTHHFVTAILALTASSAIADVGAGECDGARPQFQADEYQAFGGDQIAVGTQWRSGDAQGVLNVYDLTGQSTAPLGVNWPVSIYTHPDWVSSQMGQLFGVALDDVGNIFAAHTAIYFSDNIGAIGGQPGQVYKIDSVTGAPAVFATLPNNSDPVIAAANGINESYPGLGNLCFDVGKQAVYVSNFEDGRIYRIDASGTCLSTWDHATGIVSDCNPEAGDGEGAARLGERVWAVQTFNGRVYYSLWVEDMSTGSSNSNEIWSVAYDAAGEFIVNTQQLEITVPVLVNDYSNPVSDIAFGPAGQMMIAERTMQTDPSTGRFSTAPHASRAIEYVCDPASGAWLPSPNAFSVGNGASSSTDSAGGCDYSYAAAPNDRVFVTSDAMILGTPGIGPNVYGIQGIPQSGGAVANSILIDMDAEILDQDKSGLGSVEISCPEFIQEPCATISKEDILCDLDPSGNYTLTFDLTNNSGQDVAHLLVLSSTPGINVVPSGLITLPTVLADGDTTTISITFNGGLPGEELCFYLSLNTRDFEECCAIEHCIVVPDCDCAQIHDESVECSSDGTGCFTYTFDLDNLTGIDIYYSFLSPLTAGMTIDTGNIDPNRWDYPPVVNFGTETLTVTICGLAPGEEGCFLLTMHNQTLEECCSIEICVTAPDCANPIACPGDCNGDGVLDFLDISLFIQEFNTQVPRVDFNHDSNWDFLDISQFVSYLNSGCP